MSLSVLSAGSATWYDISGTSCSSFLSCLVLFTPFSSDPFSVGNNNHVTWTGSFVFVDGQASSGSDLPDSFYFYNDNTDKGTVTISNLPQARPNILDC
jgi:hypothetical protein